MKIWAKTTEYSEGKFLVVRRDGSVPHWPHFVLGARDPAAIIALKAYAEAGELEGFDKEYCDSIRELAKDFEAYRRVAGLGDPDAPPHRIDDPSVIEAMRGVESVIAVRPDKSNEPKGRLDR